MHFEVFFCAILKNKKLDRILFRHLNPQPMRKIIVLFAALLAFNGLFADMQKDAFVGFYKGTWEGEKSYPLSNDNSLYAEIFKGPDGYRIKFVSEILKSANDLFEPIDGLTATDGKIILDGSKGEEKFVGTISPQEISLEGLYRGKKKGSVNLKKFECSSSTMGAKPPSGAVVLFNGKNTSEWEMKKFEGKPCNWDIVDGAMVVKVFDKTYGSKGYQSDIISKRKFGKFKLHIEFKLPAEYDRMYQNRGNSGVFIGSDYEIQVLDSFGFEGKWDECGSLYRTVRPRANVSFPPEEWQTYDVEFTPAKFDGDKLIANPRITVYQNGILIHKDEELEYSTRTFPNGRASFKHAKGDHYILLQDHNHKVAFRNIWVLPLK